MTGPYRALAIAYVASLALAVTSTAAPVTAKSHSIVGTLLKVEGQTLTVQTQKGTETVMLAPAVRIHSGVKALAPSDLTAHAGDRIKVRYMEHDGQKQAQTLTLSSGTAAKQAKVKTSTSLKTAKPARKS